MTYWFSCMKSLIVNKLKASYEFKSLANVVLQVMRLLRKVLKVTYSI